MESLLEIIRVTFGLPCSRKPRLEREDGVMRSAIVFAALLTSLWTGTAGAGDKAPTHKMTQAASFLMVEPFYTTVFEDDRAVGMLMVGFGLDIPDPALRADAEAGMPLLRDYYLRNLSSFSANAVRLSEQPDVNEIAARLQRVTDRALHRKGARVLLAQVALRPR